MQKIRLAWSLCLIALILSGCGVSQKISLPTITGSRISGDSFYIAAMAETREAREARAVELILKGNVPDHLRRFSRVRLSITDSSGIRVTAFIYVMPDYLSIGHEKNFARVPLTPMSAKLIADSLGCVLPTKKMVDGIYRQSRVRPAPVPMLSHRDSAYTFWQHNLIIEGQRNGRTGLIAGIKKDIISHRTDGLPVPPDRVSIYGWHRNDGKPIQPMFAGHVNWYVDYSHGVRLIYRKIKVGSKWMDIDKVAADPVLRKLIYD